MKYYFKIALFVVAFLYYGVRAKLKERLKK